MMLITLEAAADFLRGAEDILILSHQFPDGDTLGSAAALCRALHALGKRAVTRCPGGLSKKYAFLHDGMKAQEFTPRTIVSVDVADADLLGPLRAEYGTRVDLSIDHHATHSDFAARTYVDSGASATAEIIYELVTLLGVPVSRGIAEAIYTGIVTDTGSFKYANVTPRTFRIAAKMLESDINAADISRRMLDTKTRERLEIERMTMDSLRFYFDSRCAMICITRGMIERSGAQEDDLEGLSTLPRQVEGVQVGVTVREKKNGDFKISLRTENPLDAGVLCAQFGGGGHKNAAGCTLPGPIDKACSAILGAVEKALEG